jgi:uncharacterized protein YjbI with pentapeptide repeats
MSRFSVSRHVHILLMLAIAVAGGFMAGSVWVAQATTPTTTTYYACVTSKGDIYRVRVGQPYSCIGSDAKISWNQAGPPGPQGLTGPRGIQGVPGTTGPQGVQGEPGVVDPQRCDSGTVMIGVDEDGELLCQELDELDRHNCGTIVLEPEAELQYCELQGITVDGLDVHAADFSDSDLRHATFNGSDAHFADFSGADARLTSWVLADLHDAKFRNTLLDDAVFTGADLSGAVMTQVGISGGIFDGADLHGADLRNSFTIDSSFLGANLSETNFLGGSLTNSNLTGATLLNAIITDDVLQHADFDDTTCPDGTNSDVNGDTCVGHTTP